MARLALAASFAALAPAAYGSGPVAPVNLPAQIWGCSPGAQAQTWQLNPLGGTGAVASIGWYNASTNQTLILNGSGADPVTVVFNSSATLDSAQLWTYSAGTLRSNSTRGMPCLTVLANVIGSPLVLLPCELPLPASQSWSYDANTRLLHSAAVAGACLDARTTLSCADASLSSNLYCNASVATADRVADLVARLAPADFAILLTSTGVGVPRLGVPVGASIFGECLHGDWTGPAATYTNASTGYTSTGAPTSFPHLLAMSCSFNRTLWAAVGSVVGDEDIALRNQRPDMVAPSMYFSPNTNLCKYPTWGRCQEVPGEDPTLASEFVAYYATGMQFGPDARYKRISSVCKHSAAYDLDDTRPSGGNATRFNFDARVSLGDLVQYYLPPFRACIQRAHAGGIMCSYNAINGVPACANAFIHDDIARGEWGFTGFVVSDCGAFSLICSPTCYNYNIGHNYTQTLNDTVRVAMTGGMDTACDPQFGGAIVPAFDSGNVTLQQLATSATRVLLQVFATGLMDPQPNVPYANYGPEHVDTPYARQLALEAAIQGAVLLKNMNSLLPLTRTALQRVAVVGPNAAVTQGLLSNYHGDTPVANNQSILDGINRVAARSAFTVAYAPGCASIACVNGSGIPAAVSATVGADVAIVVLGLCAQSCIAAEDEPVHEEEMFDRTSLLLPGQQLALLQAIAATGVPTVCVLVHGGALDVSWAADGPVAAILDVHYPGEMGGDAVAALLFGDASPSGRLTTTVYVESYLSLRAPTDMTLAPHNDSSTGASVPGITYMYYDGADVLFPFGYGGSYTTFEYVWFDASSSQREVDATMWAAPSTFEDAMAAAPSYAVNVTNAGNITSDVSALAFLAPMNSSDLSAPLQELFDFQRAAAVAPGQTVTLYFTVPRDVAASVSSAGEATLTPGLFTVRIGDVPRHRGSGCAASSCVVGQLSIVGDGALLFNATAVMARGREQ